MPEPGTILYNYGALQNLAGVLTRVSQRIQQDKESLATETASVRNGDAWQGAANEAWTTLQGSYDELTSRLSAVVSSFGGGVTSAQDIANQADNKIAGTFAP